MSDIILKGFEAYPNFRASDLPDVITPANLGYQSVKVHDADGSECEHVFELNRLTGEAKRYCEDKDSKIYAIGDEPVTETVILKMPITITLI